jgi:hypothetical protein
MKKQISKKNIKTDLPVILPPRLEGKVKNAGINPIRKPRKNQKRVPAM